MSAEHREDHDGFVFDRSRERIDTVRLHAFLTTSYWASGRTCDAVERSLDHSVVVGVYRGEEMVGFARAVTDFAVFAQIMDVIVWPEQRGKGLGRAMVAGLLDAPDLANVPIWYLRTNDAHGVYAKLGFQVLADHNSMRLLR